MIERISDLQTYDRCEKHFQAKNGDSPKASGYSFVLQVAFYLMSLHILFVNQGQFPFFFTAFICFYNCHKMLTFTPVTIHDIGFVHKLI
jgi:hypothetical protein